MAKRSVSTNLYKVLVSGTKSGAIKWARVEDGSDESFIADNPMGGSIHLDYVQHFAPSTTDTKDPKSGEVISSYDDGMRWVVSIPDTNFALDLNLKQKVLARKVIEAIDGTSEEAMMAKADELANNLAASFGLIVDVVDDTDDSDEEE